MYTPSGSQYLQLPLRKQINSDIVGIRYFGNLGLGRWEVLKMIGLALKDINKDGIKAELEIYSSLTDPKIIKALNIPGASQFKGWTYGEEYLQLLQDADIVVHVESFDQINIRRTWGSISTKIADYLGAGKCILAIGSKELASIDHIKDASFVVDDLEMLKEKLLMLISDIDLRTSLQEKARQLAKEKHDIVKIQSEVKNLLEDAMQ